MSTYNNPIEFTILAGGLSQTIDVNDSNPLYKIVGTATITVDNTFTHNGTLFDGLTYEYDYQALATYSGGVVKFHGVAMTATQALKNHRIIATYNGSAWEVQFIPDMSEDGIIETAKLADEAVTVAKMEDLTRGHIWSGQTASNRPASLDANTNGAILIGDGTDLLSSVVSGDIAIASTGVAAIQEGVIVNADVNAAAAIAASKLAGGAATGQVLITNGTTPTWTTLSGDATLSATGVLTITATSVVKTVKLTIPTASVLTLYTTPLTIIAAPGAGYAIEVISAAYRLTFNSIAYATNTTLRLIQDTADVPVGSSVSSALAATITQMSDINAINNPTSGQTKIIENKALTVTVATGDPTAGNSALDIYVTYRLITL
jgi:hypothetical protein